MKPREASPPAEWGMGLKVSALQAMCRQLLGFRMALIAVASPIALLRATPGLSTWLVGSAVLVTFMGSYMLFRDWGRFGPFLLLHPLLLAGDTLFAALLLLAATPDSPLAYLTACTPLLAGLVYGRKGSAFFTVLQGLLLALIITLDPTTEANAGNALLLPGFYVVAGIGGTTLRGLLLGFGEATNALTETRARLAVTEERARLARDMHDTVAKTLYGLALAADGLAAQATQADPARLREQAELVARSARRAAAESRGLLEGLRHTEPSTVKPLAEELADRVADFVRDTGMAAGLRIPSPSLPPLPPQVVVQLGAIVSEALENVARHARATTASVEVVMTESGLVLAVTDDGEGLRHVADTETLRETGHFGIVGMRERAVTTGAELRMGPGPLGRGTEVRLTLPLPGGNP